MAITAANLKWYECTTWTEGDTHGGAINTSNEITTGVSENIFDNVSDAERQSGDTEYRKIFFRNENTDSYANPKYWIQANTPATNSDISIVLGGTKSTASTPTALTGTATFEAGTAVTGSGTAFLTEVAVGEKIYNATDDAEGAGVAIASIASDTALTLASSYGGTTGSGKTANVAGADQFTYVQPDSKVHADVLVGQSLVQNASQAIWIKRVISASGDGYTDDTFTIRAENS